MNRLRRNALAWIFLASAISIFWGISVAHANSGWGAFKAVYYGSRCLLQHSDPYQEADFLSVYQAEGGVFPANPADSRLFHRAVLLCINLPTSLFFIAPLAMLAWGPAHALWLILMAASLILAAFLMWNTAENSSPGIALILLCFLLANCEILFEGGNLAGVAVSLCVVAVWCFLNDRFVLAGILCMALSLAIKPHDAGFVWLYLLLAGGVFRKRALHSLLVVLLLGLPAMLWVMHVAPHWMPELLSNIAATSARGDLSDPGPASLTMDGTSRLIDLQTVFSLFHDDPRFYNPASYLICGALLLAWSVRTLRSHVSPRAAWLALAAIAPLTMLVSYHRSYDAKLLLLTIPACAILSAEGGLIKWMAWLVTGAGIVLTADIPSAILNLLAGSLHAGGAGFRAKMMTVMLLRPAPIILLVAGIFYLWVYLRGNTLPAAAIHAGGEADHDAYAAR
jgi:hypothetical protein